jgi:hypothetical protein
MRDFYDVYILFGLQKHNIDILLLSEALRKTATKRGTEGLVFINGNDIICKIENDETMHRSWTSYQLKYSYANDINWEQAVNSVKELLNKIICN